MSGDAIQQVPWGIVLLFGGGFALAGAFQSSGLSAWVGARLAGLQDLPPILIVAAVCVVITFLTEVTSNTATATVLLPVLGALAVELNYDPLLFMVPGAISCSFAFMLPVATPPNAIVFASGKVTTAEMARTGLVLNMVGVVLTTAAVFAVYPFMSGAWAMGACSVVLGLALGSVQPMVMSTLHQITPDARHGEALGLRLMTINASSVAMPLFFGSLGAVVGVSALFWAVGLVVGASSRLAFGLRVPADAVHPVASVASTVTDRRNP